VYISRRKREDFANCYEKPGRLLTVLGGVIHRGTRSSEVVERDHRRFAKNAFCAEWVFLRHIKD
jgi:hypothetical protein